MTQIYNKTSEKVKRRRLPNNLTQAQIVLWSKLKNRRVDGYKFRRQYSIYSYVVDFYCPRVKLAVEVDGDSHFMDGASVYDEDRQRRIENLGIEFLRFTNTDVKTNLNEVVKEIQRKLRELEGAIGKD